MFPTLLTIGSFSLSSFGVFLALAFLFGVFLIWRLSRAWDLDEEKILDLMLLTFLGGLVGARLFFGLINILAVKWGYNEVKIFLIWFDILAYLFFVGLAIWGIIAGRCGNGIYSAFLIFAVWIIWGFLAVI